MLEILDIASGRYLNEAAIREHALACSKSFRAGKFTRVGSDFIEEVKADVEALVRSIRALHPTLTHEQMATENVFLTGALSDKVTIELNHVVARIIQRKVERQPSCGVTLSRTR
jgi:hypothetical protein